MIYELYNNPKIKMLFKKHQVELAYGYGSQFRGTAGPMSDIDIAVVFSKETHKTNALNIESIIESELNSVFGMDNVQIINISKTTNPLLKYEIVYHGELIYSANDKLRQKMDRMILAEYEDTNHLRQKQFNIIKHVTSRSVSKKLLKDQYINKYVAD